MRTVANMKRFFNDFNDVKGFWPVTSTHRPSVFNMDVDFLVDTVPGAVSAVSLPFERDGRLVGVAVEFAVPNPDFPGDFAPEFETELRFFVPSDKLGMMVDFRG